MTDSHRQLKERYAQLCGMLLPNKPVYPSETHIQTSRADDGSPHVELVDGHFHYVVTERGAEYERRIAKDEDELLYWLMSDVTTSIALQLEIANRAPGKDPRRQWFATSVSLLARLNPQWAARKQSEYARVLTEHPFRDEA